MFVGSILVTSVVVAFVTAPLRAAASDGAASKIPAAPAAPCASAPYHQFDFFAGDWDTFDVTAPTTLIARNRVTPMVDGCALREVYVQNDGLHGESFSTYDASRQRWHQSWVTNHGSLLLLDGRLEGNRMVFVAPQRQADGTTTLVRVVWWPEGHDVRERAESSKDRGATWSPMFDIVFRPHDPRNGR